MRKSYDARSPLWATVRQELQAFLGPLPLCYADWTREWNTLVSASDASLGGFGICTRQLPKDLVGSIGRVPERERFRRGPTLGARATASSVTKKKSIVQSLLRLAGKSTLNFQKCLAKPSRKNGGM